MNFLSACICFLRRRGPAGLRSLFFGYSVVIFALPLVYLKRGNNMAATDRHGVLSNLSKNGSKSFSWEGMLLFPEGGHTAAYKGKQGVFLYGVFVG